MCVVRSCNPHTRIIAYAALIVLLYYQVDDGSLSLIDKCMPSTHVAGSMNLGLMRYSVCTTTVCLLVIEYLLYYGLRSNCGSMIGYRNTSWMGRVGKPQKILKPSTVVVSVFFICRL